jgi:hypothetical protein
MGCAQNSWRAAQAGDQDLRTNGFQPDQSSGLLIVRLTRVEMAF